MFRQRTKKQFPEGTFIPFPARVCAIFQLCIAFGMVLWYLSQPFMGELFEIKSEKLLVNYALEHREFFDTLPLTEQEQLLTRLLHLQEKLERPFWEKTITSIKLIFNLPLLKLSWIVLAIVLSIFLLKKQEGTRHALWLLPFLALAYGVENRINHPPPRLTEEQKLFPTESYLVKHYLDVPFSSHLFEQKEQLEKAWDRYLQVEWGAPEQSAAKGRYFFNLARLKSLSEVPSQQRGQEPLSLLFLFLFWNLSYATICSKYTNKNYYLLNN